MTGVQTCALPILATPPPLGDYYIRIDYNGLQGELALDVFDSTQTPVVPIRQAAVSSTDRAYAYIAVEFDGIQKYYIRISPVGYPNLGRYTLTLIRDDIYDQGGSQNDFMASSAAIPLDAPIENLVRISGDDDWYFVTIPGTDNGRELYVGATFVHANGNLSLALYDHNDIFATSVDSATDDEHL